MQLNFFKAVEKNKVKTQTSCMELQETTDNLYEFFSEVSLEPKKTSKKTIKDFGKKIGGAKKDLWKSRGMVTSDLDDLTDREACKFVTKNNVWPKPDYKKMVEEGMDTTTVFLIKKLRDSLPAKVQITECEITNKELREKYITFLTEVKTHIENLNPVKPTELFDLKYAVLKGYYDFDTRKWLGNSGIHPAITNKFLKTLQFDNWDVVKAQREIEKTGFPEKRERWRKNILIKKDKLKNSYYIFEVIKGGYNLILAEDFPSKEEAEKFLENELKNKLKQSRSKEKEPVRPQLKHIQRSGPNYRNDKNVDGNDFMGMFKFRAGEFGNYTNQADRQQYLNHAYDALMDLADVLGVEPSKLSMGKELAIAFGARGAGRAAAHYEPTSIVINLTKMRGAGSLAHEMGHALDDYLGRLAGFKGIDTYMTKSMLENSKLPDEVVSAFKDLVNTVKFVPVTQEEAIKRQEGQIDKYNQSIKKSLDFIEEELGKIEPTKEPAVHGHEFKEKALEYIADIKNNVDSKNKLSWLHDLLNTDIGVEIDVNQLLTSNIRKRQPEIERLFKIQNGVFAKFEDSDFLKEAKKIDRPRKKPYWSTDIELFARAFECFVYDELSEKGLRSDYLVHSVINKEGQKHKPYPEGEERKEINKAFRKLFEILTEKDIL